MWVAGGGADEEKVAGGVDGRFYPTRRDGIKGGSVEVLAVETVSSGRAARW
jgi:hypothetical protein